MVPLQAAKWFVYHELAGDADHVRLAHVAEESFPAKFAAKVFFAIVAAVAVGIDLFRNLLW
jgi:hypothetical protein